MHKEEISPRKGGELIKNSLLSDDYYLLEVLKDTAATEVLHVRHRSLNSDRIIKVIPTGSLPENGCSEVELIKDLRHPGIPIIFDFRMHEDSFVIVEEYISGQSLSDILLHNTVSEDFLIYTAHKLCDVLLYLHTRDNPILYQDLKPDHIFYTENNIKLIDFGISEYLNSQNKKNHFGTKGYAAPEQYESNPLNEGVDIYAYGKVLSEISTHIEGSISEWINTLITRSTMAKREERFLDFKEINDYLLDHIKKQKNVGKDLLLNSIAISGCSSGVGVTHIAISLVTCLRAIKIPAVYKDCTGKNTVIELEKEGCLNLKGAYGKRNLFLGELELGPGIDAEKKKLFLVKDYGDDYESMSADLCIYIVGGRLWQLFMGKMRANQFAAKGNTVIVCNQGSRSVLKEYAKAYKREIYNFSTDKNPMIPTKRKIKFCKKLLHR